MDGEGWRSGDGDTARRKEEGVVEQQAEEENEPAKWRTRIGRNSWNEMSWLA
jgi:hypothetical protein